VSTTLLKTRSVHYYSRKTKSCGGTCFVPPLRLRNF
jgi:hypothetical protein